MSGPAALARLANALAEAQELSSAPCVVVQPHDYPDHDAAAAAFGLYKLLRRSGFSVRILHRGKIRSHSLLSMVSELGIPLESVAEDCPPDLADAPCVILDGSPAHSNCRPVTGNLVGVVDHHPNPGPIECAYADVRVGYGSCSTIVFGYWRESGFEMDRDTATALLMGIQLDTDFLSRKVSPADLEAHKELFFRADWEFSARVVKASLSVEDLPALRAAAANAHIDGGLFITVVPLDCSQELISILADFFLRLKEISMTVIVESGGPEMRVSVRSKSTDLSASFVVRLALMGIGHGGGHEHMAGGVIDAAYYPGEESLFARFRTAMDAAQENE